MSTRSLRENGRPPPFAMADPMADLRKSMWAWPMWPMWQLQICGIAGWDSQSLVSRGDLGIKAAS